MPRCQQYSCTCSKADVALSSPECWECLQGAELGVFVEGHTRDTGGHLADGWAMLQRAADDACLVVTEEMPTSPYADWVVVSALDELNHH